MRRIQTKIKRNAMKRFYADAGTRRHDDGSYAVCLDDRPIKTPGKRVLLAPTRLLAEAIVDEWRQQSGTIEPENMPLTQLLNTAIDRVIPDRQVFVDGILAYL